MMTNPNLILTMNKNFDYTYPHALRGRPKALRSGRAEWIAFAVAFGGAAIVAGWMLMKASLIH